MLRRFVAILSAVILACGLVPSSALASESAEEGSSVQLETGTYVEHEALAYVVADGSSDGIAAFWQGGSVLDDAKTLMEVDAQTVKDAVDESDGAQSGESAAVSSRSLSTLSESDEGRLVLVRDESKTTEQLIEELMADGNVVFAEPNYTVDAMDDGQDGAADQGDETEGQGGFVDVPSSVDEGAGGLDGGTSSQGGASSEGGAQQNTGTNDSTASAVGSDAESAANEGADSSAAADSVAFGEDSEAPAKDLSAFQWAYDNDGFLSGVSADANNGCHIYNASAFLLQHLSGHMTNAVKSSFKICIYNPAEIILTHCHQKPVFCNSCVIHQDIYLSIFFYCFFNKSTAGIKVRYVALTGFSRTSGSNNLSFHCLRFFF